MMRTWTAFGSRKRLGTIISALLIGVLISGCAGTSTATTDGSAASAPAAAASSTPTPAAPAQTAAPRPTGPAPAGQARLTLTRVEGILYAGAPATVKVNGQKVAELWAGKSETVDIPLGNNVVTVEAWSYPGTWTVNLDAKKGKAYAVEVSPRSDSYGPSLFGPLGAAMEGAGTKNAGAFQMRVVSQ
jgi:hypothetical protein